MTHSCKEDPPEFIRRTLAIIGDKYSALILRILHEGPQRFSDFEARIPGISPRTLAQRLEMLVEEQVVVKQQDETSKRPLYVLTKAGEDLDHVIHSMASWGMKHSKNQRLAKNRR